MSTRIPQVGLFRTDNHEYWRDGVGPFPGVTSVLRIIDKPAIVGWAKRETARCAVDNYDFVQDLISRGGKPAAVSWLSAIPDFQRDIAGDLGSAVHRLAEDISRNRKVDITAEQLPYVEAYRAFLTDYRPTFKSLERMVFSEKGYGGTFDWLATIDGLGLGLGDTKTSKAIYPETALQLAGLKNADHIGLPNDPKRYRMPKVRWTAVLHLRPELYAKGYRLVQFSVTDAEYEAFLSALSLTRWRKQREKNVIGESIPMPEVQEQAA
jgi:hypothetical protein